MWNCHSWPLDVNSKVKLPFCQFKPFLTTRCQYQGGPSAKEGSSDKFELTCCFMLCFTEGLFILHMKDLIIKRGKIYLLVFHRKDLCEARVKPEMSSNFQITFSDIPLWFQIKWRLRCKFSDDMFRFRYTPLGSDQVKTETQIFRWCVQIQIYPPVWDQVNTEQQIFRWCVEIQIYPLVYDQVNTEMQFSDDVLRFRYTPHGFRSSEHWAANIQMMCWDSDIPLCADNFTLVLTSNGQKWQFHTTTDIYWSWVATAHCYWPLVVKNSNFTLLLTSSGQEWHFHIATDI